MSNILSAFGPLWSFKIAVWHSLFIWAAQVSPTEVYLVVNAGCREKDLAHIGKHLDKFTVSGLPHSKHSALPFTEPSPLR